MKRILIDILTSAMLGIGFLFLIAPFLLLWFVHGNYERYLWVINGPFPFSHMGSGPFQLMMDIILVFIGLILIGVSKLVKPRQR